MDIKLSINGVDFNVTPVPPPVSATGLALVPASVTPKVIHLDALPGWTGEHDAGTAGTASGGTSYPVTIGGRTARQFISNFTNFGGFRFHASYDNDTASKNFVYSGDLFIDGPQPIAQMELDNNQVTADGKTYIFGVQQDANSGKWEVTSTDPAKVQCHWNPTSAIGDPSKWPTNMWLHFEIACHRDDAGNITYDAVHFNGVQQNIGITYLAALALGWAIGSNLVNFQLGGQGAAGAIKIYASNLQITKW